MAMAGRLGGQGAGLPWQTIVAGQRPDLRPMIAQASMQAGQAAVGKSLRNPAIALAVTTVLNLVVAVIFAGVGGLVGTLPRLILGLGTATFGMIVGRSGGPGRRWAGVASILTAIVQTLSMVVTLVAGATSGAPVVATLSMVVSIAASLAMAVKMAVVALGRGKS